MSPFGTRPDDDNRIRVGETWRDRRTGQKVVITGALNGVIGYEERPDDDNRIRVGETWRDRRTGQKVVITGALNGVIGYEDEPETLRAPSRCDVLFFVLNFERDVP